MAFSSKCKYIESKEGITRCSLFFLTLKDGTCLYYGKVQIISTLEATKLAFSCKSGNINVKNYLIIDCSQNRDNEKKTVLKYNSNSICQENGLLPCRGLDKKCYNITEMCIYRLNKSNLLTPCRTGEHVANCSLIQCNMKFKCPGFYCIPWSYVCDGKWDCPGGYDEVRDLRCGISRNCKNMFKCSNSQKCIHVGDICNGLQDCHRGDDEYMCSLTGFICPFIMCLHRLGNLMLQCQLCKLCSINSFSQCYFLKLLKSYFLGTFVKNLKISYISLKKTQ